MSRYEKKTYLCDMIALAAHIEYLLLNRQSVIVPSLGEFSTQNTPARWIACENLFLPPIRNVHFDASRQQDPEAIFLQSLAEINHFGPAESLEYCERLVADFHKQLITEGSVDFGSIGVFTLEDDAEIVMASCECGVTTPNYYGLDALNFVPLCQLQAIDMEEKPNITITATTVSEPAAKAETENIPTQPTMLEVEGRIRNNVQSSSVLSSDDSHIVIRIRKSTLHYAMAVAASILLFFVLQPTVIGNSKSDSKMAKMNLFVQPNMVIDNSQTSAPTVSQQDNEASDYALVQSDDTTLDATLSDFTSAQPAQASVAEEMSLAVTNAGESAAVATTAEPKATTTTAAATKTTAATTATVAATTAAAKKNTPATEQQSATEVQGLSKFSIVLASGVPQKNAEEYAAKLNKRGVKAVVVMDGKMRRVVVACSNDQAKAYQQLAELKKNNEDLNAAWMLKK